MTGRWDPRSRSDLQDRRTWPPGCATPVTVEGRVALPRASEETVYAVVERCGHRDAPLSHGEMEGQVVTCPTHGTGSV